MFFGLPRFDNIDSMIRIEMPKFQPEQGTFKDGTFWELNNSFDMLINVYILPSNIALNECNQYTNKYIYIYRYIYIYAKRSLCHICI